MIETCMHCGIKENTHNKLSLLCGSCWRPRAREIWLFGSLACDCETYAVYVGDMAKYDNAVVIGGHKLELGGRPVFVDANRRLYQLKE